MRGLVGAACSLITFGLLGLACDNDPTVLPTGGAGGAGGESSANGGNSTTGGNGGDGNTGNQGGDTGGHGGGGGTGGTVQITTCTEVLDNQELANDIVISEISIGNYIEVYNPTVDTKSLGGVAYQGWRWCSRPSYVNFQSTTTGISLPPQSYRTIPWPALATVGATDGEIALYVDANFGTPGSMVDYVCWGVGNALTRKDTAEAAGQWDIAAACAASTTNGVIRRLTGNIGSNAASWDSTATADPTNCDQP